MRLYIKYFNKLILKKHLKQIYFINKIIAEEINKLVTSNIREKVESINSNIDIKNLKMILNNKKNLLKKCIILSNEVNLILPYDIFIKYISVFLIIPEFRIVLFDEETILYKDNKFIFQNYYYKKMNLYNAELFYKDLSEFDMIYDNLNEDEQKNVIILNKDISKSLWKFLFNTNNHHYKLTPYFISRRKILINDMGWNENDNTRNLFYKICKKDAKIIIFYWNECAIKLNWHLFIKYWHCFCDDDNVILLGNNLFIYDDNRLFIQKKKYMKYIAFPVIKTKNY